MQHDVKIRSEASNMIQSAAANDGESVNEPSSERPTSVKANSVYRNIVLLFSYGAVYHSDSFNWQ